MASDPSALIGNLLAATGYGQTTQQRAAQVIANQNGQQQNQIGALQIAAAQQQQARAQQYQQDTQAYFNDPRPERLAQLIAKYPDQAQQIQQAHAALDEPAQQSRTTILGSIYNAARNNQPDLIASQIDKVIAAEQAQGVDTAEATALKAALAAKDPNAVRQALAFAQAQLAITNPAFAKQMGIDPNTNHFSSTSDGAIYDQRSGETSRDAPVKPTKVTQVPIYDDQGHRVGTQLIDEQGNPVNPGGGGQASGAGGGPSGSTSGAPRSVRNNNPGNIIDSPFAKSQPGYQGSDGHFAIFSSPEQGSQAQAALLRSYIGRGYNTVAKIIGRWAPPSDGNDTGAYISRVAKALNVNPNDTLSPASIPALQSAISGVEKGGSPSPAGGRAASGAPQGGFFGPRPSSNPDTGMSPEEINYYGQQVADGAPLPTLGMGKEAAAMRRQILAKAADINIDRHIDGGAANLLHAQLKANTHSLTQLTGLRTLVAASEGTASSNLDQVLQLAPKGVGGSIPVFNRWIQAGRRGVAGDADVARMDVAVTTAANEYAKVMTSQTGTGGVTSDSARAEAHRLLNSAQSLPQLRATIQQMRIDMRNRKDALATQDGILRGNISGPVHQAAPTTGWGHAQVVH